MAKIKRRKHDNSIAIAIDARVRYVQYAMCQKIDCGVYGFDTVMKELAREGSRTGNLALDVEWCGDEAFCYQMTYCLWLWSLVDELHPEEVE